MAGVQHPWSTAWAGAAPFGTQVLVLLRIPKILPFGYYHAEKLGWFAHIPHGWKGFSYYEAAPLLHCKEDVRSKEIVRSKVREVVGA